MLELSREDQAKVESTTLNLFYWLQRAAYYLGFHKGINVGKDYDGKGLFIDECSPHNFKGLSYCWYYYYGGIYIRLNAKKFVGTYPWPTKLYDEWSEFQVLSKGREILYRTDVLLYLFTKIDNSIHHFFPKIIQTKGLRPCTICGPKEFSTIGVIPFRECTPIGNAWLCDKCIDLYSLAAPNKEEKPDKPESDHQRFAREQRAKMTQDLRYSILERDGFRCQICGRCPREDEGVKLEVDHIKPIFKDGLTEPDNLQTLCRDCNQGKGVKDFWVDPKPQREVMIHGQWFGEKL